jgi:hypothetical protein
MFIPKSSPYLKSDRRLGDVIAAIQALGIYRFYLCSFKTWSKQISGDETQAEHWKTVFVEHPEFFRLDPKKQKAGLVLRRQRRIRYDTQSEKLITKAAYSALDEEGRKKISREPLTPDQINALIDVAIKIHSRASEQSRDRRWWFVPLMAFLGAIGGALIGANLKPTPTAPAAPIAPLPAATSQS